MMPVTSVERHQEISSNETLAKFPCAQREKVAELSWRAASASRRPPRTNKCESKRGANARNEQKLAGAELNGPLIKILFSQRELGISGENERKFKLKFHVRDQGSTDRTVSRDERKFNSGVKDSLSFSSSRVSYLTNENTARNCSPRI